MPSSPLRKPTLERRREIAECTLRLVGERGITALSTASLAESVGLSTGALFRHFTSMEEILEEAVSVAVGMVEATFPPPNLAPLDRLLELARRRIALVIAEPGVAWLLRSHQASTIVPTAAAERLGGLALRSRSFLLDALRQGAGDGSVRDDVAPEILVVPVVGTIHTLMGMPGFQRLAAPVRDRRIDDVLAGLARLLAPPPWVASESSDPNDTATTAGVRHPGKEEP